MKEIDPDHEFYKIQSQSGVSERNVHLCPQTPEVVAEQRCSDCQSAEDLWICLVCGYVGCGR